MKKVKSFILTGMITMVMLTLYSPTNAVASGPLETYADCVESCINKYEPWTLRRSLCGGDCYIGLIGDALDVINPF